jgi:hypothetical protein
VIRRSRDSAMYRVASPDAMGSARWTGLLARGLDLGVDLRAGLGACLVTIWEGDVRAERRGILWVDPGEVLVSILVGAPIALAAESAVQRAALG